MTCSACDDDVQLGNLVQHYDPGCIPLQQLAREFRAEDVLKMCDQRDCPYYVNERTK